MTVKTRLKTLGAVAAACALALGLSGCGGGDKEAAPETPEVAQSEEVVEEVVEEEVVPTDGIVAEYGVPFGTDLLTFTIIGTGESNVGKPNYKVEITNNTDELLVITDGGFTVNGQEAAANVNTTIKAGETTTTYFSFSEKVGTDGSDLVDISGVINIQKEGFEQVEDFKVYLPDWEEGVGE